MSVELRPYPEYKDSKLPWSGEVPAHWEVRRLRAVINLLTSNVDKNTDDGELPVRLCNYVDVYKRDSIDPSQTFMKATATALEIEKFRLQVGDVLITKDSEDWEDIGVPAIVLGTADDLVCGYHLCILRPSEPVITGSYLYWQCRDGSLSRQFSVAANGITRYGLSQGSIKNTILIVPPLAEQQAIAAFLTAFDQRVNRFIRAKQRMIELLNEQKQAIIQQAVTRGLDPDVELKPSGVDWLGDIPAHWEVRKLKHLSDSIAGGATPRSDRSEFWDGPIVWVTPEDVSRMDRIHTSRRTITERGLNSISAQEVPIGSLIVTSRAPIGNVAIAMTNLCTNQGCKTIKLVSGIFDSDFAFLTLTAAKPKLQSIGNGSTFAEVSTTQVSNFRVAVPPFREQLQISVETRRSLNQIDASIASQERTIELIREYRTRLIADVVTGKLDVRGVELPPMDDEPDDWSPEPEEESAGPDLDFAPADDEE